MGTRRLGSSSSARVQRRDPPSSFLDRFAGEHGVFIEDT
jgi:hypothetical protein